MASNNCTKISDEIVNIDPQLVFHSDGELWKQIGHAPRRALADDLREQFGGQGFRHECLSGEEVAKGVGILTKENLF